MTNTQLEFGFELPQKTSRVELKLRVGLDSRQHYPIHTPYRIDRPILLLLSIDHVSIQVMGELMRRVSKLEELLAAWLIIQRSDGRFSASYLPILGENVWYGIHSWSLDEIRKDRCNSTGRRNK
ncbi:hypothetical protein FRC03_010151 [Tulasnella sp. 419]|nr:hypothetical protein FRC03_010151 [Tulasnella sp. 419]